MVKSARWISYASIAAFVALAFAGPAQETPTPASPPAPARPPRARRPDKPFELQALTPEFWKIFDKSAKLNTLATGFGFTEGPVWDPAGFLWVSDESKNQIVKVYE